MTQRFANGSVVRLKSGGPRMTVVDYGTYGYDPDPKYKCRWFDSKNTVTEQIFSEAELELADAAMTA